MSAYPNAVAVDGDRLNVFDDFCDECGHTSRLHLRWGPGYPSLPSDAPCSALAGDCDCDQWTPPATPPKGA